MNGKMMRGLGLSFGGVQLVLVVARHASFVEAARRIGISIGRVSSAIARVGEAVGTRLLQRTSRRVSETEENVRLVARSRRCWPRSKPCSWLVDRDLEPAGTLRVDALVMTVASVVVPALFALAARYPRVVHAPAPDQRGALAP